LRVGSLGVSWRDAIGAIFNYHGNATSPYGEVVVRTLRVPRTVVGLGVGVSLGVTGALMQGLTRNPLADPGLLGINSGAGLAMTLCIMLGVQSIDQYVWFGFLGAAIAGVIVYVLGSVGGVTPVKLVLAGAIFSSVTGAFISAINLLYPDVANIGRFVMAGSVAGISTSDFLQVTPFMAVGLVIALGAGKALNGLSLGDEVARSLGQRIVLTRGLTALSVVLLAGAAVAVAGPIAFVGLIVPHVGRWLVGPDYRWIIPTSALLGPSVVLLADVAGRVVAEPAEIQAGIMVAIIGGPFFIILARRRRNARESI
jgi:iron complex transport system permease protein